MLKINLGVETAAVLEKTRRAMNLLQSSVKRVASGVSIESAGDDPGAIGSVVLTETAISGIQRTLKNINEGITITQALTSDLTLVEDLLLTLRDVAVQAASDQFTDLQRASLQKDAESILKKIDTAVKEAGNEHGYDLTNNDSVNIQGSSNLGINTQIVLTDIMVKELGKRAIYTSQRNGVFTSPLVDGSLVINGIAIRPTTTDDDTVSTTANDGSAIAKALAINTATYLTGVSAESAPTSITGNRQVSALSLTGLNYFTLNGSVINGVEIDHLDSNFASLQEAINAETKFTGITASLTANGELVLTAEDGRNIQLKYSNQDVLSAVGITDKEGDVPNLNGVISLGNPDRDLNGEVQLPINTDFQTYAGNVSVSGRFDASEDYVDFVAHVVTAGGFGSGEFRLDRDPTSEVNPAEDFAFIDGVVDPNVDTSSVTGNFFTLNGGSGTVIAGGDYNEGLDRDYVITATKAGTTDGSDRAEFQVATAEDGVVGSFTASANTNILIANARTGEDVFVQFSTSPRASKLTNSLAPGHAHDTPVTLSGAYTGLVDGLTTVEVITSGRTQGTPQATVQVYHDGVAFGGITPINGDVPIDIGNGQRLTFTTDIPVYGGVDVSSTGGYNETVTVNSDPLNFTGIGSDTYRVNVTKAGVLGEAEYVVEKIDAGGTTQVVGASVLNAGTVSLTEGITFNFPNVSTEIGNITVNTTHSENVTDHYQAYGSADFNGTYDGAFGDTSLLVRVKREGVVLDSADSIVGRSDYALLEYSIDGAAFTGDLVARRGDITISNGVNLNLSAASSVTTLVDPADIKIDFGSRHTFSGAAIGYDGDISFDLDSTRFRIGEDTSVEFTAASSVQVNDLAPASGDTLTIRVVGESGTIYHSTAISPVSSTQYTIADGLTVSFINNPASSNPSINALSDEEMIQTNTHSLQESDQFSVNLSADPFAIGDKYSVDVDSAHLQDQSIYTIQNLLGRFEVGNQMIVDADHDFQASKYTINNSVDILNGLNIDFDQDGSFEIGDEVRFQVRGYTGDPVASGTYTYAISPTSFTVEVLTTGDVDGGIASFQYTRADTGETVGGFNVTSGAQELDDGVNIAFTAGRVYAGDTFFIDTFESLDQTFGGKLTLSSANTMTIEMLDTDTDNFLGRVTYAGDTPKTPGTDDNLTSAFLALNSETAVGQIDLSTQPEAIQSVKYTENAQESLDIYQQRVAITQAELEDLSSSLANTLTLQEEYLQDKLKVDVATEGDRSTAAITQLASNAMLSTVSQQMAQGPMSLLQQSLIPVVPSTPKNTSNKLLDRETKKEPSEDKSSTASRLKELRKQKDKSAQNIEKMMKSIENAQSRSASVMASISALRQFASAHISANQSETDLSLAEGAGDIFPAPNQTFDRLITQISSSVKAVDTSSATSEAKQAISQAESSLREMKSLALVAQTAGSYEREELQAEINELIVKLREQPLPQVTQSAASNARAFQSDQDQISFVFSSAVTRQLGQFDTAQSRGGVDPTIPLEGGGVIVQTALGQKIPIRRTTPADDPLSVRDSLGSALAKANAINASTDQHGITAIGGPTVAISDQQVETAVLSNEHYLRVNGVEISGISVSIGDQDRTLTDALNAVNEQTGIKATNTKGGQIRLMAIDGRNITVDAYGDATKIGLTPRGLSQAESRTTGGALTLSSRSFFTLETSGLRGNPSSMLGHMKMVPINNSLENLDLTSTAGIIDTLSVIDLALADLSNVQDILDR